MTNVPDEGREPHHHRRHIAEAFGSDPESYDRIRPRYPQLIIDDIVDKLPGRRVLDIGCGTGIAARQLREAGCSVVGIEPDERMATFARNSGLTVHVGNFEAWGGARRPTFDGAVAAQSWHWVNPRSGADRAANILHPGGHLVAMWNVSAPPDSVSDAFIKAYSRVGGSSSAHRPVRPAVAFERIFDATRAGIAETGRFKDVVTHTHTWSRSYDVNDWIAEIGTHGDIRQLSEESRRITMDAVSDAIRAIGGSFVMECQTVTITAILDC